jgi:hypothetical protein
MRRLSHRERRDLALFYIGAAWRTEDQSQLAQMLVGNRKARELLAHVRDLEDRLKEAP